MLGCVLQSLNFHKSLDSVSLSDSAGQPFTHGGCKPALIDNSLAIACSSTFAPLAGMGPARSASCLRPSLPCPRHPADGLVKGHLRSVYCLLVRVSVFLWLRRADFRCRRPGAASLLPRTGCRSGPLIHLRISAAAAERPSTSSFFRRASCDTGGCRRSLACSASDPPVECGDRSLVCQPRWSRSRYFSSSCRPDTALVFDLYDSVRSFADAFRRPDMDSTRGHVGAGGSSRPPGWLRACRSASQMSPRSSSSLRASQSRPCGRACFLQSCRSGPRLNIQHSTA